MSSIIPVMVGTAGHVHHGKSSLVKLLTGCDTMRLPEERRRALTIELGYAPCTLGGNRLVGIVDVPGHEDFIRTMVAGASCIDVLLLVVAADDGPMPQTLEHLTIVATLRSPQAMAVVTKTDLVDAARAAEVEEEVKALLARAGFPDAPVVRASNKTGDGYEHVYSTLERLVDAAALRPADNRAFRHDIERVFATTGHGTVVTGVARCGTCAVGDALEIIPAGLTTQLKGAQAYRQTTTQVAMGSCTALNLKDVPDHAVSRGMTVASPGIYRATSAAVVWLTNVSGDLILKRRQEVRLHAGTTDEVAMVRLLEGEALPPGAAAAAVITLRSPMVLASGDRILLRLLSPSRTITGGVVLAIRERDPGRTERDLAERSVSANACLRKGDLLGAALSAAAEPIINDAEILCLTQLPAVAARAALTRHGELIPLGRRGSGPPSHWGYRPRLAEILARLDSAAQVFHREHPNEWGLLPRQAAEILGLPGDCADDVIKLTADDSAKRLVVRHGRLAIASFAPALPQKLMELRDRVLDLVTQAGMNAPARGNLVKDLACSEGDMDTVVKLLVSEGRLRVLGTNLMPAAIVESCRAKLAEIFAGSPSVDLNTFRTASGLSRNLSVAVLELFDREGLTRRQGLVRVAVKKKL